MPKLLLGSWDYQKVFENMLNDLIATGIKGTV
jgi:hypothetical protein